MSKKGEIKTCPICTEEFEVVFGSEKYCCKECNRKASQIKGCERRFRMQKKTVIDKTEKICVVCGLPFETVYQQAVCCSGACRYEYTKKKNAQRSKYEAKGYGEASCAVCGTVFKRKSASHKFCSAECAKQYTDEVKKRASKKKQPKSLLQIQEDMKAAGYAPHEYGKYMAAQYLQNH